jgi:hypothetical protein
MAGNPAKEKLEIQGRDGKFSLINHENNFREISLASRLIDWIIELGQSINLRGQAGGKVFFPSTWPLIFHFLSASFELIKLSRRYQKKIVAKLFSKRIGSRLPSQRAIP